MPLTKKKPSKKTPDLLSTCNFLQSSFILILILYLLLNVDKLWINAYTHAHNMLRISNLSDEE